MCVNDFFHMWKRKPKKCIKVYGTSWCFDCQVAVDVLDSLEEPYDFVDIDQNREGEQFVFKMSGGNRSTPTIKFPDGSILVGPSPLDLKRKIEFLRDRD